MKKIRILSSGLIVALLISLAFIGGCAALAPEGGDQGETSIWPMILFLVFIFVVMYFVMIRPQRKKQKLQQQLLDELKRGDRVITAGGVYGVIESLSQDSIVLKIESGATIRVARGSVAGRREK